MRWLVHFLCLMGMLGCVAVEGQPAPDAATRHAQAGQSAQQSGNFPVAIREYSALAQLLPQVAEVHSNLGIAYFFNGQREQSVTAFERALRLKPDLVPALIFCGIALHDLGRPKRAGDLLEKAVTLAPHDPLPKIWLGFSYWETARPAEAAAPLTAATNLQPANVDAWYGLGNVYLELGRLQARKLADTAPDGAKIRQLAADLWRLRGQEDKAGQLYAEAQARSASAEEEALYRAATDYRERAQAAFDKVRALAPDSARAHQVLADSLTSQRRTQEAIAEYREVLRASPHLTGIHAAIGDLWMSEGKAAEALVEYQSEARLRPNDASLLYRMGRALVIRSEDSAAEQALQKALSIGDAPPGVWKELAKVAVHRQQHEKAAALLTKYLEHAAGDASAYYLLMGVHRALGNSVAAQRDRTRFQELSNSAKKGRPLQDALSLLNRDKETLE